MYVAKTRYTHGAAPPTTSPKKDFVIASYRESMEERSKHESNSELTFARLSCLNSGNGWCMSPESLRLGRVHTVDGRMTKVG